MGRFITQRELRNDSGEIMRGLDRGTSYVVTCNGTPVGELTPLRRRRFVTSQSVAAVFRNAPGLDAAQFRDDLDRLVDQSIDPKT